MNLQVACAAIRNGDFSQVLLARRHDDNPWGPGLWEMPGGKVDAGETAPSAAVREIREELGVELVIEAWLVSLYDLPIPYEFQAKYRTSRFSLHCFVGVIDGDPRPLAAADLGWFKIDEPLPFPAVPGFLPLVAALKIWRDQWGLYPRHAPFHREK